MSAIEEDETSFTAETASHDPSAAAADDDAVCYGILFVFMLMKYICDRSSKLCKNDCKKLRKKPTNWKILQKLRMRRQILVQRKKKLIHDLYLWGGYANKK